MKKRMHVVFLLIAIGSLLTVAAGSNSPQPVYEIILEEGLPPVMKVGETYQVKITVTSDIPFLYAMAMPSAFYPGRFVVAQGPNRAGTGTEATLYVPFTAKSPTLGLPEMPDLGVPADHAPVSVAVGMRYKQGVVASAWFSFNVMVVP